MLKSCATRKKVRIDQSIIGSFNTLFNRVIHSFVDYIFHKTERRLRQWERQRRQQRSKTVSRMLARINAARAVNALERQLAKLASVPVDLHIIDDFGLKPLTGIQNEDFHEVISEL